MKNQTQKLKSQLQTLKKDNNRMVERIARKGLRCTEKLDGRNKRDAMRLYIHKAKSHMNNRSSRSTPDYEGNVLNRDVYEDEDTSLTSYSIIDSTKVKAKSVNASIINVTTIESKKIKCDVLDSRSVKTDDLQANVIADYDTKESIQKLS